MGVVSPHGFPRRSIARHAAEPQMFAGVGNFAAYAQGVPKVV